MTDQDVQLAESAAPGALSRLSLVKCLISLLTLRQQHLSPSLLSGRQLQSAVHTMSGDAKTIASAERT